MAKSQQKRIDKQTDEAGTTSMKPNVTVLKTAIEPLILEQPELSSGEFGTLQEMLFGKQMVIQSEQLSSLHAHVEERLASLQQRCDQQFAELHRKLDEGLNRSDLKLDQANDKSQEAQGKLEDQLKKTTELLTNSMHSSRDDIMRRLDAAIADLDAQKLDKGALSSLLGDVATQLTGQTKSQ